MGIKGTQEYNFIFLFVKHFHFKLRDNIVETVIG